MRTPFKILYAAVPVLFVWYFAKECGGSSSKTEPAATVAVASPPTPREPATFGERFLAKATEQDRATSKEALAMALKFGWLRKPFDPSQVSAVVGPGFYAIDFEVKQALARDLLMARLDATKQPFDGVALVDSKTNKTIGTINGVGGSLNLD